jgi:hypothetical protein
MARSDASPFDGGAAPCAVEATGADPGGPTRGSRRPSGLLGGGAGRPPAGSKRRDKNRTKPCLPLRLRTHPRCSAPCLAGHGNCSRPFGDRHHASSGLCLGANTADRLHLEGVDATVMGQHRRGRPSLAPATTPAAAFPRPLQAIPRIHRCAAAPDGAVDFVGSGFRGSGSGRRCRSSRSPAPWARRPPALRRPAKPRQRR